MQQIDSIKPNVLLIITDDQAYGDLSLTGNPYIETPAIDKLADEGIFAKRFYVSPVCAPTRASLLTGRYHQRTGVSGVTRGREDMRLNEVTIADILKNEGYSTGAFGKWHNGAHYPYHPLGRGFDEFIGFTSGHWSNYINTTIEKNGATFKTTGYLPDVLTTEAIQFMRNCSEQQKPFFCYVPYQTPHTPLQVPDAYFDKYKEKGLDDFNATIYGMCENIDDNLQRLLSELEELEIRENTIVIYLSDNGPLNFRYNAGLKGRKGMVDEGGVKVPFIINWTGTLEGGKRIKQPLAHIDILPTLIDLLQLDYKSALPIDGRSFAGLLKGENNWADRSLYSEWSGKKRVLAGDFLMINDALYNLAVDSCQTKNIRKEFPLVYDSLNVKYNEWYSEVVQNGFEQKAIPVGYADYTVTTLPAHEATLFPPFEARKDRRHTGIAYHSLYGWAHDWIDFWTSTGAYAQWEIDVVEEGEYEIEISYALAPEDVDVKMNIEVGDKNLPFTIKKSFVHRKFENHDRVLREQEAPETDWGNMKIGKIELSEGTYKLRLGTTKIPGTKSAEVKSVKLSLM
ncbi:arylsulfatase [uncultured Draconibacterium sp.]|uniref:arylsulfatase n=1 Tax=uncultured Draconibacterium sp. TaxID=1573823 RepID=UPI0029C00160|nr:arylsulfatase [uncultured Draconibacterium sp.]